MVLLVVDTQKAIINSRLYQFDLFESHVKKLIDKARDNGIEVIFVRHDDGVGNELTKGNNGFEVYERFQPKDNEIIFDKNVNSSFKDTGLLEYLNKKEEKLSRTQQLNTVKVQALRELGYTEINTENAAEVYEKIYEIESRKKN